ncbi:hypothetical protein CLJ_B2253 [Clostridium botulinum Ba4 str. 657]|uniref:Uncharacterized protein n=1 Tax=Clostridium botulinum (strain 657 / Type Ba4) TaxID=515621 RepID=A0A3F2ZQ08_CLOB6|nr:hypothetical protein CLJ_B2253 [Clostridium botulinum Ba4 str. 657]
MDEYSPSFSKSKKLLLKRNTLVIDSVMIYLNQNNIREP